MLYRVARRLAGDPVDAEDLVGQALLNAAAAWPCFDGRYPRGWLIRILTNCHYRVVRERKARPTVAGVDPAEMADEPWSAIDWTLCGPALHREVDRLPEEYRLAVALCDVEGLSYEEGAEALQVAVGTLKSRLFRGRRILRARLAFMMEEGRG